MRDVQIYDDLEDEHIFELWYADPCCEKILIRAPTVYAKQAWVADIRNGLKCLGISKLSTLALMSFIVIQCYESTYYGIMDVIQLLISIMFYIRNRRN